MRTSHLDDRETRRTLQFRKSAGDAEFRSSRRENRRLTPIQLRGGLSLVFDARIGREIELEINGAAKPLPKDAAVVPMWIRLGQGLFPMRSRISRKEIVFSFLRRWIIFQKLALV